MSRWLGCFLFLVIAARQLAAKEPTFIGWKAEDPVEVYYTEFLLAHWVLDHAPWNAYHSALAFVNNRTQARFLFDFSPLNTSSVMNMVLPEVVVAERWKALLLGDAQLLWHDAARIHSQSDWPPEYQKFVRLGRLNGSVFFQFSEWVTSFYAATYKSFQPVEVLHISEVSGQGTVSDAGGIRSRMCHDFVTDALWELHRHGVKLKAASPIFRDHLIMYAKSVSLANEEVTTPRGMRRWLRYLRQLELKLELIRSQFTYAREALMLNWKLGLPAYIHDRDLTYLIELTPPFLNYCYLPLAIPPQVHKPLNPMKLCALGMQANLTNSSAPWPWSPLLATEERLDRPEVILAFGLLVLTTTLQISGSKTKKD